MPPSDSYRLMQVFLEVVRANSFAAAASRLGMKPPAVSKSISKLEREFGAQLINRSTRSMSLTDVGRKFLLECRHIVEAIDALQENVTADARAPTGTLRATATPAFGQHVLAPLLPTFFAQYPRIRMEMSLTDRLVDLHAERIDIAFRSMPSLKDSSLFRLQLSSQPRVLVASPAYVAAHGEPCSPEELNHYACLVFRASRLFNHWSFRRDGDEAEVIVDPLLVIDNYHALLQTVRGGAGIANLFCYQVADDLDRGTLVRILPQFELPQQNIFALYSQRREKSPKIDIFLRHLENELSGTNVM